MAVENENEKRLTKEEKEMQLLLDSMLVPFSDYKKNLAANRKLEPSDEDKKLLNEIFVDCTYNRNVALKNFSDYFYLIPELSCHESYSFLFPISEYKVYIPNNARKSNSRLTDIVEKYEQCRAYEYFVYFGCILNDLSWLSQDKVLCAVAEIFMLSFAFYGDA